MAMKVKTQDEEDIPEWELYALSPVEGKPIPRVRMTKKALASLFSGNIQRSFLEAAMSVKVPTPAIIEESSQPKPERKPATPPAPPPAKAPPNNVLPFKPRQVEASNDDAPRSRKRGKKGGGGNGGFQDQCPELKAWLAAFNPIPNNLCLLEEKDKHIRATEHSQRVRLVKYGDSQYRPVPPEWKPIDRTEGWWGDRPPTLEELFSLSRKISARLPQAKVDLETRSYVKNNLGKVAIAPPCNDPNDPMLLGADTIDTYDAYLAVFPDLAFSSERVISLSNLYLVEMDEDQGESVTTMPPILSCCKLPAPVVLKKGIPFKTHPVGYSATFKDERIRQSRAVQVNDFALSYRDIKRWDVPRSEPPSEDELELAYYMSLVNNESVDSDREYSADLMSSADKIRYSAFLSRSARSNEDLTDEPARHLSFFALKGLPENDEKWCLDNWLLHRGIHNSHKSFASRYDEWWFSVYHRDEQARLDHWFLEHPGPAPDVKKRVVITHGDMRWNMYVRFFNKWRRNVITKQELEQKAKAIWDTYWGVENPTKVVVGEELAQWAALMEDDPQSKDSPYEDWIIPPNEINELVRQDTGEPLIPHHDEIIERIAQNRLNHLSLKRGWRGLKKKLFRKKEREGSTIEHEAKSS